MKKEGKNKSKAALITMMLLLSMVLVLTTLPVVNAAPAIVDVENNSSGISGENILINASGFDPQEWVWINLSNGAEPDEELEFTRANLTGVINSSFYVPWRSLPGDYTLNLTGKNQGNFTTTNFTITDIYKVEVDPAVIYWDDTEPQEFTIKVYNWTGSSYTLLNKNIRYMFWVPDNSRYVINNTMNTGQINTDALFNWSSDGTLTGNREANYTLNITLPEDPSIVLASIWVPVRFHLMDLSPTTAVYNDEKTLTGKLIDGGDDNVVALQSVNVVSPTGLAYYLPVTTTSLGRFSFSILFNESGTWYIGTEVDKPNGYRPTDIETTKGRTNFIWYGKVEVSSGVGTITVDPTETTYGFDINLDIYCEDAQGDLLAYGNVFVTGVEIEYPEGVTHDAENFTRLGATDQYGWLNLTREIDQFKFNESGTATFWVYYDENWTYYDANPDVKPLISASTNVAVGTPTTMNVFIDYDAEEVDLNDYYNPNPAYSANIDWANMTNPINVTVYGKTDATMKNASIKISGCGIDQEFEETLQPAGGYSYLISPRNGGVLTVTVTNETSGLSVTEDTTIIGLVSNAVTSIGGDKEITIDTEEMITFTVADAFYAEVHLNLFADDWEWLGELNMTNGTNVAGNGDDGIYKFTPDTDTLGHIVIGCLAGYGADEFYTYDIVDIVPKHDLVINITTPDKANLTLTAGLEYDIIVDIFNLTGAEITTPVDYVEWELLNETNEVLDKGDFLPVSGNTWQLQNYIFCEPGTLLITAVAYDGEHDGNNSEITVGLAVFEYMPSGLTVGMGLEGVGVDIIAKDAVGNLLKEADFTMNRTNAIGTTLAGNSTTKITDEFGEATIWFTEVGDHIGSFRALLGPEEANTSGELEISWPIFTLNPEIIYVGYENDIYIKATDLDGNPIEGMNLSLTPSILAMTGGSLPDPIATGVDGWLMEPLSIHPTASGTLNVTIAQDIGYVDGQLNWTKLLTDTVVEAKAKQAMTLTVSKSPIYQGETLTVTVKAGEAAIKDVDIKFGSLTGKTDANGKVDFLVPDPGVESATYYIIAEKIGYVTAETGITVIKKYAISIDVPDEVFSGESFTVTIIAKGQPLAGATVTLDGTTTKMSDGDGKVTFTAGAKDATHTIKATFVPYTDGQATVGPVKEKGIPGFELLTLVIAIGVAFILLRRRKQN